jgi:DNA-binding transcriptional ArsR family regulator
MNGEVFKALASPVRREILSRLSHGDLNAGQIADGFDISKPSISNHLAILKRAGLISDERDGRTIIYRLNETIFQELMKWLIDFSDAQAREKRS